MPGQRFKARGHTVHLVDAANDEIVGIRQQQQLTWQRFGTWLQILLQLTSTEYAPFRCLETGDPQNPLGQHGPEIVIEGNTDVVEPGFYVLLTPQGQPINVPVTEEKVFPRTLSQSLSGFEARPHTFRDRVRARDGRCIVTGDADPDFAALDAAHIFPLAHRDMWISGRWKNQLTDTIYTSQTGMDSVQNGILLRKDVHVHFDRYALAIDPDHEFRAYNFCAQDYLDNIPMYRNTDAPASEQPCVALLKHHFRMAVLLNMKGRAGYPQWDEDFEDGDQIRQIAESEQGKLRFELMLASKLGPSIMELGSEHGTGENMYI